MFPNSQHGPSLPQPTPVQITTTATVPPSPPTAYSSSTEPAGPRQNLDATSLPGPDSTTIVLSSYKLPEHHPRHVENGRTYHGYRRGIYMLPCDEEEQDRLDLFHKVITEARVGDGLIYAPHPPNARVLDLGCGTGIWAIDVANKYPEAFVVGLDLVDIQPLNGPKNCDFYSPRDFEYPWALGEDHWDLIHMQMGSGCVASWPSLYRKIFSHLRPGGWFEQVEIDFEPRCEERSLENTSMSNWYQYLKQATEMAARPIAHSVSETMASLERQGFVQIDHQIVGLPLNPWHHDEHEKKVGRWYNLAISESLETLSLAPMHRIFGFSHEQIKHLAIEVKKEAYNKEIHAYNILHIYQARKPENPPGI
ncbi:regulator of secondary metabolism LaeA [Talaromyces proteolyticus]|uniref:Velvet complex subunit laeA n=1 Tax=Talaromyces proteolyticus TaxID=1131652 RepID=A0AAD4KT81_9EURO|nr:regulator of secondary metabolism LaeA [Talaromyces proteolyticus]KAH8698821.1 regulator of secondary metabolism LaeA [Talaromyces proteolyticus]